MPVSVGHTVIDSNRLSCLYGIRTDERIRLHRDGTVVRLYVPCGSGWYAYFTRCLAERSANLLFLLRALTIRA